MNVLWNVRGKKLKALASIQRRQHRFWIVVNISNSNIWSTSCSITIAKQNVLQFEMLTIGTQGGRG